MDNIFDFLTGLAVIMLFLSISAIDSGSIIPFVILGISLAWILFDFAFLKESR